MRQHWNYARAVCADILNHANASLRCWNSDPTYQLQRNKILKTHTKQSNGKPNAYHSNKITIVSSTVQEEADNAKRGKSERWKWIEYHFDLIENWITRLGLGSAPCRMCESINSRYSRQRPRIEPFSRARSLRHSSNQWFWMNSHEFRSM